MPNDNLQANIQGAIAGALHVHQVAKFYNVPVILHTDHASKKWLPWISALIDAGEQYKKEKSQPLFSFMLNKKLKSNVLIYLYANNNSAYFKLSKFSTIIASANVTCPACIACSILLSNFSLSTSVGFCSIIKPHS